MAVIDYYRAVGRVVEVSTSIGFCRSTETSDFVRSTPHHPSKACTLWSARLWMQPLRLRGRKHVNRPNVAFSHHVFKHSAKETEGPSIRTQNLTMCRGTKPSSRWKPRLN